MLPYFIETTVTRLDIDTWDYGGKNDFAKFIGRILGVSPEDASNYQVYYDVSCAGVISALDDYPLANSVCLYYNPEDCVIMSVVTRPQCDTIYDTFFVTDIKTSDE